MTSEFETPLERPGEYRARVLARASAPPPDTRNIYPHLTEAQRADARRTSAFITAAARASLAARPWTRREVDAFMGNDWQANEDRRERDHRDAERGRRESESLRRGRKRRS